MTSMDCKNWRKSEEGRVLPQHQLPLLILHGIIQNQLQHWFDALLATTHLHDTSSSHINIIRPNKMAAF